MNLLQDQQKEQQRIKLNRNDNIEDLNKNFVEKLNELDEGDGVLVLADLLGGSPSNVASLNLKKVASFMHLLE